MKWLRQKKKNLCFVSSATSDDRRLPDRARQRSGMEAKARLNNPSTQMFLHQVRSAPGSDGSCNSPSGSAVSALQSKVKKISQRQSQEDPGVPLEGPSEPLRKKPDQGLLSLSVPEVKSFKMFSTSEKVSKLENLTFPVPQKDNKYEKEGNSTLSLACGLGEGSGIESFMTRKDGGTILSEPRYWTPPKGFRTADQRETLISNRGLSLLPVTMRNVKDTNKEEQDEKPRPGGPVVRKELQEWDGLESTFQRCFQKVVNIPDEPERADTAETEGVCTIKPTSAMLAEGRYQPSVINKGEIFYRTFPEQNMVNNFRQVKEPCCRIVVII